MLTMEQILEDVRKLPLPERISLAERLNAEIVEAISEVIPEPEAIRDEELLKELERRWAAYERDPSTGVDAADFILEMRRRQTAGL